MIANHEQPGVGCGKLDKLLLEILETKIDPEEGEIFQQQTAHGKLFSVLNDRPGLKSHGSSILPAIAGLTNRPISTSSTYFPGPTLISFARRPSSTNPRRL